MTDPQTPEPTPAVERAARALDPDPFMLQSPANRKLLIPPVTARAHKILAAALDVEEMTEVLARFRWEHRAVVLRSDRAWDESDWGADGPHARNLRIRKNAYLDGARKDVTILCTHLLGSAA